jgi:hypothetical protein
MAPIVCINLDKVVQKLEKQSEQKAVLKDV